MGIDILYSLQEKQAWTSKIYLVQFVLVLRLLIYWLLVVVSDRSSEVFFRPCFGKWASFSSRFLRIFCTEVCELRKKWRNAKPYCLHRFLNWRSCSLEILLGSLHNNREVCSAKKNFPDFLWGERKEKQFDRRRLLIMLLVL